MNLGQCQSCNQRAELHKDVDDRMVCEDCKMGRTKLGKEVSKRMAGQSAPAEVVSIDNTPRRERLLDFIAANAPDDWVRDLIESNMEDYRRKLQDFGWLEFLEKNPERALLRIATKMGYKEATPRPPTKERNVFLKKRGKKDAKKPVASNLGDPDLGQAGSSTVRPKK